MSILIYLALFVALLVGLVETLQQMSSALEEADLERFLLWVCIGSTIAGIPVFL